MTEWKVDESPTPIMNTRYPATRLWDGKVQGKMMVNNKGIGKKARLNSVKHVGILVLRSGPLRAWYGILG